MIKVLIQTDSRYPVDRKRIREKVKQVLQSKGVTSDTEVSLLFVGDRKMKELNRKYRGKDETTDVLSFVQEEGEIDFPRSKSLSLGDVIVSFPQVRKQAAQYNVLLDEEIDKLVEHGLLHLLGIHHE